MLYYQRDNKEEIIQEAFRNYTKTYSKFFKNSADRIFNLLGKKANYYSGIFREGLIKDVLKEFLPDSVSVDTGFIYGFGKTENSKQIDIIIWDSTDFAAIYRGSDFVIVPPEAVISIISVKSKLNKKEIADAINNIWSVTKIEDIFRNKPIDSNEFEYPIKKFIVCYQNYNNHERIINNILASYDEILKNPNNDKCLKDAKNVLKMGTKEVNILLERYFPIMICDLKESKFSLRIFSIQGETLHRPFICPQRNRISMAFDKMMFEILMSVANFRKKYTWSSICAWLDCDPVFRGRPGDAMENILSAGKDFDGFDSTKQ